MAFVVDASAALPWCFVDETTPETEALLNRLKSGDTAFVPPHWSFEVANSLLMALRRGRIGQEKRDRFLEDLRSLPIQPDMESMAQAFDRVLMLAEQYKLTVYDAAYLELALRRGLPLASLDADLCKAAQAEGVPLLLF